MKHYLKYGFKNFYIAVGYKSHVVKKYFKSYKKNGKFFHHKIFNKKCKITIVDTGHKYSYWRKNRFILKRLENFIQNDENFFFTYDAMRNFNSKFKKIIKLSQQKKKIITVTAVRPPARFGELKIKKNKVVSFKEKPQTNQGWINGGFFVAKKNFSNL